MEHCVIFALPMEVRPANDFISVITKLVNEGVTKLHVVIASHGGNTRSGICCLNLLKLFAFDVTTYNIANADSAAVPLFLAGSERIMTPNSSMVIHRPKKGFRPDSSLDLIDLEEARRTLAFDTDDTVKIIADRTGMPMRRALALVRDGRVLGPEDALKLGIATKIAEVEIPREVGVTTVHY